MDNKSSPSIDVAHHLGEIEEQGYTILEGVLLPDFADEISAELARVEQETKVAPSKNDFEGRDTLRVYNLLVHGKTFERVPVQPDILAIVDGVLDEGCLLSTLSSINIGPGETPQLIHSDDQVIAMPRPHPAVVCNSMLALTEFTEANGATRLVPGSHKSGEYPNPTKTYESIPAEMEKGSVLMWHGSLWHGGGANQTDSRRIGIANNYCAGFIRQQENQQLGVPREIVRGFEDRLRRLVGYGVFRGLIGHIDKHDPIELLGEDGSLKVVWDR
jgi:ectoine hydroxylase-related dioxygenase (phytanoyl-CoA dioxygenase family)